VAIWSRLTAFVTGGAVATAAADAMRPEFEVLGQTAWKNEPHRVLEPGAAAELRARESVDAEKGIDNEGVDYVDDAARRGIGSHRFDLLTELARTNPDVGNLFALRRRGIGGVEGEGISAAEFRRLMRRHGYTAATITQLEQLLHERLDPGQIAAAIHRGLIPDPGLLKGQQPVEPFNVDAYPVYQIPALAEAAANGYDHDRLGVLVGLQGLPMGVIEAAQAHFRGVITHGDYIRAFNESNNRNEWAAAVLEYAKQIPTARDYIENALRGYRTLAKAQEGAARHGMSPEDALLIFQNSGRPLNPHQITQALAWGGEYQPAAADNPDPWVQAVLLGAVRPEYYNLQEHLKYNLPSAFFFRVLQQQKVLTEDEAVTWYERLGWPPDLARKVAAAFVPTGGAQAATHVAKAQTQLWSTLHSSYLAGDTSDATALDKLGQAGVPAAQRDDVLAVWKHERELDRGRLTAAQLRKAWAKNVPNPKTGVPWTRDEALAELLDRGWNQQDANTFLDTPTGN
jgi:hypothetical protein